MSKACQSNGVKEACADLGQIFLLEQTIWGHEPSMRKLAIVAAEDKSQSLTYHVLVLLSLPVLEGVYQAGLLVVSLWDCWQRHR